MFYIKRAKVQASEVSRETLQLDADCERLRKRSQGIRIVKPKPAAAIECENAPKSQQSRPVPLLRTRNELRKRRTQTKEEALELLFGTN